MNLTQLFRKVYLKSGQFAFKSPATTGTTSCGVWLIISFSDNTQEDEVSIRFAYVNPGQNTFFEPSEKEKNIYITQLHTELFAVDQQTTTFVLNYKFNSTEMLQFKLVAPTTDSHVSPALYLSGVKSLFIPRSIYIEPSWNHRLVPFFNYVSTKTYVGEVFVQSLGYGEPN